MLLVAVWGMGLKAWRSQTGLQISGGMVTAWAPIAVSDSTWEHTRFWTETGGTGVDRRLLAAQIWTCWVSCKYPCNRKIEKDMNVIRTQKSLSWEYRCQMWSELPRDRDEIPGTHGMLKRNVRNGHKQETGERILGNKCWYQDWRRRVLHRDW